MSSQPPMGDHFVIPQNDILYTNKPALKGHFACVEGWLLIAGSIVYTDDDVREG